MDKVNFEAKTTWVMDSIVMPEDSNRWEQGIKDCADGVNAIIDELPALPYLPTSGGTVNGTILFGSGNGGIYPTINENVSYINLGKDGNYGCFQGTKDGSIEIYAKGFYDKKLRSSSTDGRWTIGGNKILDTSDKAVPNGVAPLDGNNKLPEEHLPEIISTNFKEKADKDLANTGFISGCIVAAPNGVISGGDTSFWYDSWAPQTSIKKYEKNEVLLPLADIRAAKNMTVDEVNGDWQLNVKVKFSASSSGAENTKKGPFATISFYDSAVGSGSAYIYVERGDSSGSTTKKPFQVRIRPVYGTSGDSYEISTSLVPQQDTWYWLKLEKTGTTYKFSYSTNGTSYQSLGSVSSVPAFSGIPETIPAKFLLGAPSSGNGNVYADFSSEETCNVFIGSSKTPLVTYVEGSKSVIAKSGVSYLLPAGISEDGTLNSQKVTLKENILLSIDESYSTEKYNVLLTQDSILAILASKVIISKVEPEIQAGIYWYDVENNKSFKADEGGTSWVEAPFIVAGEFKQEGGAITYFKSKEPARILQPGISFNPPDYTAPVSQAFGTKYQSTGGWLYVSANNGNYGAGRCEISDENDNLLYTFNLRMNYDPSVLFIPVPAGYHYWPVDGTGGVGYGGTVTFFPFKK